MFAEWWLKETSVVHSQAHGACMYTVFHSSCAVLQIWPRIPKVLTGCCGFVCVIVFAAACRLQFVHMMVDSDPGASAKHAYTGRRISLDLAASGEQATSAPSPAPAAAAPAAAK